MKNRIVELDLAKGFAILLIVFSHLTYQNQFQRNFVSLFHVPIFFIIAGYFFKNKSIKEYMSKGLKKYLLPAYIFLIFDILKDIIIDKNWSFFTNIQYFFKTILFLGGSFKNFPIWFLPTLFILIIICNLIKNEKHKILIAIALIVINNIIKVPFDGYFWPMCVLYGFPFFITGYFINKLSKNIENHYNIYIYILTLFLLLFLTRICGYNSMTEQIFEKGYILFFISGIIGFYNILSLCNLIKNIKLANFLIPIGLNTKFIVLTHYYICRVILPKLFIFIGYEFLLENFAIQLILLLLLMISYVIFFHFYQKCLKKYVII